MGLTEGPGGSMSQVVGLPNNSYKPITNTAWVHDRLFKLKKGCTRLATASDKVYQLLAHDRWFSPGTPASSTTKTSRHDIAEIWLKVALNIKNQSNPMGLKNLFSLDRYLVDTGSNYIDIYGIVKSVWLRQVFSLFRVRFRQISLYM